MTDQQTLFAERTTAWLLVLPCSGAGLLALGLLLSMDAQRTLRSSEWWAVPLTLAIGLMLLVFAVGFRSLGIAITQAQLTFGFPIYRKRFAVADLQGAQERPYKVLRDFYGWGIRLSPRTGEVGFIAFGSQGVRIRPLVGREHTFSCRDPQGAIAALSQAGVPIDPPLTP